MRMRSNTADSVRVHKLSAKGMSTKDISDRMKLDLTCVEAILKSGAGKRGITSSGPMQGARVKPATKKIEETIEDDRKTLALGQKPEKKETEPEE